MFRPENVETGFQQAHELSEFCGLSPFDIVVFRPKRLLIHSLLIRVTTQLSVPDGPDYEELGLNLRGMVAQVFDTAVVPNLPQLEERFEFTRFKATEILAGLLKDLRSGPVESSSAARWSPFNWLRAAKPKKVGPFSTIDSRLERLQSASISSIKGQRGLDGACVKGLLTVVHSIIGHRGRLVGDNDTIIQLAVGQVLNDWGSWLLDAEVSPLFEHAVDELGYRFLPAQEKPLIMNVKGASAAGKSTIRPQQRILAEQLGVDWQDFALISPDYWRKFLLEYESLGEHAKYGAMLTGHELVLIDRKLDRQMAQRAEAGQIPHLLIDRFRFDSFSVGGDQSSKLLTRFGHTVYMFYMITPPQETVTRAYTRGLSTGRYKAVDDLLDHNVEAYTGMPSLFFSWAQSSKKVHHEFLDNNVPEGERPRTVAFGWNDELTILDISKMLDIDRYKRIDIEAQCADEVYLDVDLSAEGNMGFLLECASLMHCIRFADQRTGRVYGELEAGAWVYRNFDLLDATQADDDALAALEALGWRNELPVTTSEISEAARFIDHSVETLGEWQSETHRL
ncbi:MAG: hypothetical protein HRU27_13240 [Rhizobiaceae bacterium]|nr:zeta toxin family protein [Hyphomicrobiales bacterium]NRB31551.1 hypothetical protein [Rhizobiaceae bacterium]